MWVVVERKREKERERKKEKERDIETWIKSRVEKTSVCAVEREGEDAGREI